MRSTALPLIVAALVIAACEDSDDGGSSRSTETPPPAATETSATAEPEFAAAGPAVFSVIAGKAVGVIDVEAFMPADLHVRRGDTVQWTAHGYEGHTITFASPAKISEIFARYLQPNPADPSEQIFNPELAFRSDDVGPLRDPEQFINSGFTGVPAEANFSLTFEQSGVFQYICLIHPFIMRGTVSVDEPDAPVESPSSVSARGRAEFEAFLAEAQRVADDRADAERSFPGPDGTAVHHINVGLVTGHAQVAAFTPTTLAINSGDTVIFENDERNFHNVVFRGSLPEPPPGVELLPGTEGRGFNIALDNASARAVDPPPEGFDDQTFLSSGSMGITMPRLTWRLTFTKPGRYIYNCTIHVLSGMAGVIQVR